MSFLRRVIALLFGLSVLAYGVCSLFEQLYPGSISYFRSPSWLLVPVIITGLVAVRIGGHGTHEKTARSMRRWPFILLAMLGIAALTWFGTFELSIIWRVSIATYAAVASLGILLIILEE